MIFQPGSGGSDGLRIVGSGRVTLQNGVEKIVATDYPAKIVFVMPCDRGVEMVSGFGWDGVRGYFKSAFSSYANVTISNGEIKFMSVNSSKSFDVYYLALG